MDVTCSMHRATMTQTKFLLRTLQKVTIWNIYDRDMAEEHQNGLKGNSLQKCGCDLNGS